MSLWTKMISVLRGGDEKSATGLLGGQAYRILDQEIREATDQLRSSETKLRTVLNKQKSHEGRCAALSSSIQEFEGYVSGALEKSNEALAYEVAEKVASYEKDLNREQKEQTICLQEVKKIKQAIDASEQNIKRLRYQLDTVKATENVLRAQALVADREDTSPARFRTALDSLAKIREVEAEKRPVVTPDTKGVNNGEEDLYERLKQAGIVKKNSGAEAVLERIKKKIET